MRSFEFYEDCVNCLWEGDRVNNVNRWIEIEKSVVELDSMGFLLREKVEYIYEDIFLCVVLREVMGIVMEGRREKLFVCDIVFSRVREKDLWFLGSGEEIVKKRIGWIYEEYMRELSEWE